MVKFIRPFSAAFVISIRLKRRKTTELLYSVEKIFTNFFLYSVFSLSPTIIALWKFV